MDESESFIQHYFDQVYDPVKAHQYYEDHKKLTGRSPGQTKSTSSNKGPSKPASGAKKAPAKESAAAVKARMDAEVAALKARLEQLRNLLRELVKEAKLRSGIDPTATEPSSEPKADEKLTPAEKTKKAEEAHDYYEKTKGTLPSQESTHVLKQKIALIEKKIAEVRAKLAAMAPPPQEEKPPPSESDPKKS